MGGVIHTPGKGLCNVLYPIMAKKNDILHVDKIWGYM